MGTYGPETETLKATAPSLPIYGANHLLPAGLRGRTAVMCLPEDYPRSGAPGSGGRVPGDPKAWTFHPPHFYNRAGSSCG